MPVLNIYAEQDHLVPPAASKRLKDLVGSQDYSELSFRGGHIGIYVSSRAQKEVPGTIHEWLAERSRSEEHTSELQSLMRISYAVFCLKKKKLSNKRKNTTH